MTAGTPGPDYAAIAAGMTPDFIGSFFGNLQFCEPQPISYAVMEAAAPTFTMYMHLDSYHDMIVISYCLAERINELWDGNITVIAVNKEANFLFPWEQGLGVVHFPDDEDWYGEARQ